MPYIDSPILHAVLQYLVALSAICSIAAPLFAKLPRIYAILQRVAGLSLDLGKVFGVDRVPTPTGPAPASAPLPPVSPLAVMLLVMWLGIFAVWCTAKQAVAGALSVEELACVLAQAELGPQEPAAVAAVCSISPTLIPEIVSVFAAKKRAAEMAK